MDAESFTFSVVRVWPSGIYGTSSFTAFVSLSPSSSSDQTVSFSISETRLLIVKSSEESSESSFEWEQEKKERKIKSAEIKIKLFFIALCINKAKTKVNKGLMQIYIIIQICYEVINQFAEFQKKVNFFSKTC